MMDEAEFLSTVHKHIKAMTIDGALGMAGYMWKLDQDDSVSIFALDVEPPQAWLMFLAEALKDDTKRIAFCLDRYGKPHQGTTFDDLVAGMYFDRDFVAPRPFIVEYSAKPDHRALWFNWQNSFWNAALRLELASIMRDLRAGKSGDNYTNVSIAADGKITPISRGKGR